MRADAVERDASLFEQLDHVLAADAEEVGRRLGRVRLVLVDQEDRLVMAHQTENVHEEPVEGLGQLLDVAALGHERGPGVGTQGPLKSLGFLARNVGRVESSFLDHGRASIMARIRYIRNQGSRKDWWIREARP